MVHDLSSAEPRKDAEEAVEVGTDQFHDLMGALERPAGGKKETSESDDEWMDKARHAHRVLTMSGDAKSLCCDNRMPVECGYDDVDSELEALDCMDFWKMRGATLAPNW